MANLPETPQWEEGIYQIEVSDPVLGGPDGISNRQAKQLASRTSYLKQKVEKGAIDFAEHIAAPDPHIQYAPKASPVFTGNPTAPTPAVGDNSKKLPTTEFVVRALAAATGSDSDLMKEIGKKLAKDQNGADVPDPALFVKNLGLKEAAKRDVGTGANQIPDMSAWTGGGDTTSGWRRSPDGYIEQWGLTVATTTDVFINFPIPFPTGVISINEHDHAPVAGQMSVWQFYGLTNSNVVAENIGSLSNGIPTFNASTIAGCRWFATGR